MMPYLLALSRSVKTPSGLSIACVEFNCISSIEGQFNFLLILLACYSKVFTFLHGDVLIIKGTFD
jgi:hypothetical protein